MDTEIKDWLPVAFWLAAVLLTCWLQGWLMPAVRRTPPGPEAHRQAFALHVVGAALYLLPWAWHPTWQNAALALLTRLVFFDPALNRFSGRPAFEVGQTATFDRLLRRLSPAHPERLRRALFLASLAAYAAGVATILLWTPAAG